MSTPIPMRPCPNPTPVGHMVPRAPCHPGRSTRPDPHQRHRRSFSHPRDRLLRVLDPVSGTGPRRHRPTAWPGCGHWLHFLCLARVCARTAVAAACIHRWAALLGIAIQRAFAASFLDPPSLPSIDTVAGPRPRFTIWWQKRATPIPLPQTDSPQHGGVRVSRAETCAGYKKTHTNKFKQTCSFIFGFTSDANPL